MFEETRPREKKESIRLREREIFLGRDGGGRERTQRNLVRRGQNVLKVPTTKGKKTEKGPPSSKPYKGLKSAEVIKGEDVVSRMEKRNQQKRGTPRKKNRGRKGA